MRKLGYNSYRENMDKIADCVIKCDLQVEEFYQKTVPQKLD